MIRRGGAGEVVVVVVAGVVVVVELEAVAVVVVEDPVATRAPADLSGSDSRRRTAETSTVVHATTSESPSIAATRLRIRPGSHAIVARPWIP